MAFPSCRSFPAPESRALRYSTVTWTFDPSAYLGCYLASCRYFRYFRCGLMTFCFDHYCVASLASLPFFLVTRFADAEKGRDMAASTGGYLERMVKMVAVSAVGTAGDRDSLEGFENDSYGVERHGSMSSLQGLSG